MTLMHGYVPKIEMRQLQCQLHGKIICEIPLFELSLADLDVLKKYIESMPKDERENIGTESGGGSGRKAFNDINLRSLIAESGATRSQEPDARVRLEPDGKLSLEYLARTDTLPAKEPTEQKNGSLIRGAKGILGEINWVQATIKRIYEIVVDCQSEYLATESPEKLNPLTQKDIADSIGIHPSTVSRLISNKYVQGFCGELIPLGSLITGRNEIDRLRAYEILGKMIRDGSYPKNDEEAARIVNESLGTQLARRTITKYRLGLQKEFEKRRVN